MTRISTFRSSPRAGAAALALALALALAVACPAPAQAFFQQTKLEGTVGRDLGGVWLSVQQVAPEFRISVPKPPAGGLPVEVGPLPAELAPLIDRDQGGVVVTSCREPGFCSDNAILVGDILTKINGDLLKDVAAFRAANGRVVDILVVSIRRPALKMTTARLLKVKFERRGREAADSSVEEESLDVRVLDAKLPFLDQLEETRRTHELFRPTARQLEDLGKGWAELPANDPPILFHGEHRFASKDSFDEALAADDSLGRSSHALLMNLDGNPAKGGGKLVDVYGLESLGDKELSGNYVSVAMASAPFPINVEFKGRFVMTRIADWSDADDKLREKADSKKEHGDFFNKICKGPLGVAIHQI